MPYKSDFKGTGTMEEFIEQCMFVFEALNNVDVIMPPSYGGNPVELEFEAGKATLNMGDALIFSLENVDWNFSGDADIDNYEVTVSGGRLTISVEANAP